MCRDTIDFSQPLATRLLKKQRQRLFVQPSDGFGQYSRRRKGDGSFRRSEIVNQAGFANPRFATVGNLDGKESLVNHLAQAIDDPGAIKINACRLIVVKGMENCTLAKHVQGEGVRMPPHRLAKRL